MAQRRMFSLRITDTDKFIAMPATARLLYYELATRADDDGFVDSPMKILKMIGCSIDDFKVLCGKQYVIPFDSGVCVISDWRIHNYIQKDRKHDTHYKNELKQLNVDGNGTYTMDTERIQDVHEMDSEVRLGKGSIGKDREERKPDNTGCDVYEKMKSKRGHLPHYCRIRTNRGWCINDKTKCLALLNIIKAELTAAKVPEKTWHAAFTNRINFHLNNRAEERSAEVKEANK